MKVSFSSTQACATDPVVVFSFEKTLTAPAKEIDTALHGALTKALEKSRFKGKVGQTLELNAPVGFEASRVLLVGLGAEDKLTVQEAAKAGGSAYAALASTPEKGFCVKIEGIKTNSVFEDTLAAAVAQGILLRSWRCDQFKTKQKPEEKPALESVCVCVSDASAAQKAFAPLEAVTKGAFFTRDVVTLPPNILYPESYAKRIQEDLSPLGIKVEILSLETLKKLGMGALIGVGQGSEKDSCVVVMEWQGGQKDAAPVAFVGKGVTFDTGGISLKPAQSMDEMKYDMAGSAAVVGVLKSLALRKASVNAVGVVGLVENMPSGSAQRPGDIVTTMSGQTVEVLNTDAEGRLVLADALWYTQDRFKPQFMVNLATLTGAIVVALGDQFAGLFSNNDELCDRLTSAGQKTGEKLWRLPLDEAYDKDINSPIADMQNISEGRKAGSITAAQFLQRFVNDTPWAHLDIAGMAWAHKDMALCAKGATGFGVRLLDQLVKDHYEG
ncbi:MAG: leucyl aminopeptidase [Alphaproteobacteria bacterium]|jgi:leucyl aminopeptidase|nr:leucyl aminopeptidase [Alphaproteobacteria bacterium]